MVLTLIGLVFIVVFAYFVAKTSKDNGRNSVGWCLACLATGFGLQWFVPLFIGIAAGVVLVMTGTPVDKIQEVFLGWAVLITIFTMVLSVVGMFLILRHVSQLPDDDPETNVPPPPVFDQDQ